jgi:hypothetical protein
MCTTEEFMNATITDTCDTLAWIRPTFVGFSEGEVLEASGFTSQTPLESFNCLNWNNSSDSYRGMAVYCDPGHITITYCDKLLPIACCGPAQ